MSIASHSSQSILSTPELSMGALREDPNAREPQTSSNALVRACGLPPELVVEIFMLLRESWPPGMMHAESGRVRYGSGWMAVLHICAAWRQIALLAPMLWQDINGLSIHPSYAHEILARSAGLGLHLRFLNIIYSSRKPHDIQALSRHIGLSRDIWFATPVFRRLETLVITLEWPDELLLLLLSQEAPSIYHLTLTGHYGLLLPSNLLGAECRQLRQLCLRFCYVPSHFSLFTSSLTHLKLSSVTHGYTSDWFSIERLPSVLGTLHALEHLVLYGYFSKSSSGGSLPKVTLQNLKYMSIDMSDDSGAVTAYIELLKNVSLPSTVEMIVTPNFRRDFSDALRRQTYASVSHNNSSGDPIFELDITSDLQWFLYGWDPNSKMRIGNKRIDVSPGAAEGIPDGYDSDEEQEMIDRSQKLHKLFNTARPQSLVLGSNFWYLLPDCDRPYSSWHEYDIEYWKCILASQDVRCLTVCYCDHDRLCSTLRYKPNLFPVLTTIILTNVYREWDAEWVGWRGEFSRQVLKVHECKVDATMLSDMAPKLIKVVGLLRKVEVPLKEVRMKGPLAMWDGVENARTLFSEVGVTSTVRASGDAESEEAYSLFL